MASNEVTVTINARELEEVKAEVASLRARLAKAEAMTITDEESDYLCAKLDPAYVPKSLLRKLWTDVDELAPPSPCSACGKEIKEEYAYAQDGQVFHSACWLSR